MVALQERNFSTEKDRYSGHKVVAMPSSRTNGSGGPLSVRDVVTSPRAFDPNRPRSLSAGRATTRSRDIVQEVYDRMGVNRGGEHFEEAQPNNDQGSDVRVRSATPGRGRELSPESAEKFSQRYRAAAKLSSPRSDGRGRNVEQDEPRRSRSLSRGRAVAGRWPPAQNNEHQSIPQPVPSFLPRKVEEPLPAAAAPVPASPNRNRTYSRTDSQEDNTESDSSISKESLEKSASPSVPSIKDRISVYAGVRNSARNFPQKKPVNYQTYASQKRPAPIDIYEGARKQDDTGNQEEPPVSDQDAPPPEPSAVPPSPAAAAAADAAFAFVRGGSSSRSVKSAGPTSRTPKASGIAGAYLGAIKSPSSGSNSKPVVVTQPTSAPLTEISAADPSGDGHSVAASSVSADEFNFTSPTAARSVGGASAKKPSWAERNRPQVSPPGRNNTNGNQYSSTNGGSTKSSTGPSASDIEKLVEQRVQARVSVVEMRMEEQMQRLERRVEEKLKMRIDMLDEKIDKMNSMLAMLLSRELNASSGREHRDNEI